MQECKKCGRKIKTLYERVFGERPHYEPSGYVCRTCRIFYDAKTSQTARAVSGVTAKNAVGVPNAFETERMQTAHEPHAIAAQNAYGLEQERMRNVLEPSKIEHERTLDHLCVRQVS